jgi:predicted HTH domain antitoxin
MGVIQINLPENVLISTGQSREEFVREAKYFVALKLFELGRLSSGRAAALCEVPRVEFLLRAGQAGIALADLEGDELDREFADA